jgi:alkylhydroperoxidase family enzyme
MANVADAPAEVYEGMFGAETPRNLKIYSNSPALAQAFAAFAGVAMGEDTELSPRLQELVRLRIAFHNQCRSCMAIRYRPEDEVPEDLVCSLERPQEADDLTFEEQVAIEFADRMATDHLSIDAAFYDRLRAHFTERQIVELGAMVALCVGFGRLEAGWRMTDHVPDHFSAPANGEVTPWGATEVLRPAAF